MRRRMNERDEKDGDGEREREKGGVGWGAAFVSVILVKLSDDYLPYLRLPIGERYGREGIGDGGPSPNARIRIRYCT